MGKAFKSKGRKRETRNTDITQLQYSLVSTTGELKSNYFVELASFNLCKNPMGKNYYSSYFAHEEMNLDSLSRPK